MRTEKAPVRDCTWTMAQVCLPVAAQASLTKTSLSEMSTVYTLDFHAGFSVEHAL